MTDKTRPRLFEILKTGLEEGIAHERGEKKLRVTELSIEDPPAYSGEQVQAVRRRLNLSQALLANVLAVSVRTVQAWEQDRQIMSLQAARLLQIVEREPDTVMALVVKVAGANISEESGKALITVARFADERGYSDDPEERFFGPPLVKAEKATKKKSQSNRTRKTGARWEKVAKAGQPKTKKKSGAKSAKAR